MTARTATHELSTATQTPVRTGIVQRKCACGGTPGPTGECAECRRKRLLGQSGQTKLRVGRPNDKYEREADAASAQVMRMATTTSPEAGTAPPSVQGVLRSSGGRPLDSALRRSMETRFGHDFSQVRIHTDARAAESAQAVQARAYTVGTDLVFDTNEYRPHTRSGQALLAHELTHVIQQTAGGQGPVVQRACRDESFYSGSSNYCRDDTFSPSTHPGKTCYRQIPQRDSYFSCPPGEHVCFDSDGNCEDSPDRSSLAEGKEDDGSCNWNTFCVAEHTAVDFIPEVADQAAEPFREIGREMSKALDWRNWLPLAGY